ncbi:hypothetical protein PLEOSDRAFT_1091617 [Pleurotus ostreatus PC15]|uniref:Cell cycle control protein n=1 Tax=Pleurotus ostreatus (strain PC15) TaxID=1137138 RepID=A0A067P0L9_PLEO1|nr:hypothetical protein PLEOSDRAFT_1091617 [Pleurotus ostreatus PC15]
MGLFNRKNNGQDSNNSDDTSDIKKEKGGWRRPANTAFKQQRLKAWQPILTPKTVLPTFFIISVLFAPIGGLLIWGSSMVSEITIDYTGCENLQSSTPQSLSFTVVPSDKYSYHLRAADSSAASRVTPPQYARITDSNAPVGEQDQCILRFDIPADMSHTVLLYYKMTNFYQNHRRYVKSFDSDQLKGKAVSIKDLRDSDCKPLDVDSNGKAIYPCGLIANSLFNDTFSDLTLIPESDGANFTYAFSSDNIAWPGEHKKYTNKPDYDPSAIVPPPNWQKRFPDGYNESNIPRLADDQHFQNWMRTAGLPTFTKLYGRNDNDNLPRGRYEMRINTNYPVQTYKGTKSIVISTVAWIGGKNSFLGWAYVAASGVFMLLAILGLARHLIKPRKLGDMSQLSWNR